MNAFVTLACALIVLGGSAALGHGIMAAAGASTRHELAPAVGLGALLALAWGAANLLGPWAAAGVVVGAPLGAMALLGFRAEGSAGDARPALITAGLALGLATVPFLVEGRFGILGTGLNPDMAQHLLAADRLAGDGIERLAAEGYPMGPHAIAVGLEALAGAGLVQAFSGLTIAVAPITALVAFSALSDLPGPWRVAGSLLVAFTYLAAAFFVQGAFKETMQALFVLAFAIGLADVSRRGGWGGAPAHPALLGLPLAMIAAGAAFAYSFPGLGWVAGALGLWLAIEAVRSLATGREALAARVASVYQPLVGGLLLLGFVLVWELGRMVDFARFETFDPDGAGLGNLFGRISPLEALGIWPSGDFRVEPGAGAVGAWVFWLGGALALAMLAIGLFRRLRAGETALAAGLGACAVLWLYGLVEGTPYQEAKAIVIAAPLATLLAVRGARAALSAGPPWVGGLAGSVFLLGAALSSGLALVNGPVGPTDYSPAGNEVRAVVGREDAGSTLVQIAPDLLEERGAEFVGWELRGGRVCIEDLTAGTRAEAPPPGIARVVSVDPSREEEDIELEPPFLALELSMVAGPYVVWERLEPPPGPGPCPLIEESQRAEVAEGAG